MRDAPPYAALTTAASDRRGVCPFPNSMRVCCCPATEAARLRGGGRGTSPPPDAEEEAAATAATEPLERADIVVREETATEDEENGAEC